MTENRSILSNAGVAASSEVSAEQVRRMKEHLTRESANIEAERECSQLSAIEYERRDRERNKELSLDDVIMIPGPPGGERAVIWFVVQKGTRLRYISQETA